MEHDTVPTEVNGCFPLNSMTAEQLLNRLYQLLHRLYSTSIILSLLSNKI